MVATATAPANFKTYQDRKQMSEDELQSVEQFKLDKEMHRQIRRLGGPEVYSIYTHLVDSASKRNEWGCWPTYESIMEDLGILNRPVIADALQWLFDAGLMEWGLEGRKAWFIPLRKADSSVIELLLSTPSFRNRTKDSSDRELKIVLIENANVYQSNVNQENDKTLDTDVSNGAADAGPAKVAKSPLKEIESEINQDIPASASSPPDTRSFNRRWRDRYEAVKDNSRDRSGVLGELWVEITGQKADYQLLNQLAKQQGSGFKVLIGLLKMAACDVVDDPKRYLRKVLSNEQQRGPYLAGNGAASGRTFQPAPKPIKPRGSRPDGGFSTAEYLEDY
jgi:hypothetical protein